MAFMPSQPYKLVIDEDTTRSVAPLPPSLNPGLSALEYAMLTDADTTATDLEVLYRRLMYLLRRIPGDELNETASVSLLQPLTKLRTNLIEVQQWIQAARAPR